MLALRLQERLLRVRQIRSIRGWISLRWDACMRPQSDEVVLDDICCADRGCKDDAVKASISVPVLNRQSIQLGTKQAQETARFVRRKHCQRAHTSSNYALAVTSCDNILHGIWSQIRVAPGMSEAQIPVLNRQTSSCTVFHTCETRELHGFRGR